MRTLVSILVVLKKTKQDELNENLQEEDEQIDNEFFIQLCSDLMSDDCNVGARNDEDVFVYWICLTLAQWQYTFNITEYALESLIKPFPIIFNAMKRESNFNFRIAKSFTGILYKFNRLLSFDKSFYRKYTVCTKCCSLYDPDKCKVKYRGQNESAKCTFIKFPNHHQEHQRTK